MGRAKADSTTLLSLAAVFSVGIMLTITTWVMRDTTGNPHRQAAQATADLLEQASTANASVSVQPLSSQSGELGADLGSSVSINQLAHRFVRYRKTIPDRFEDVAPLIRFSTRAENLNATLVAGPFATVEALNDFCRIVRLQLGGSCESTTYEGDSLTVEEL